MKLAACCAGVALLWFASVADAQKSAERVPAGYTEAIREALSEFELGNFTESREQFRKAHAIDPNGRTFRGLGVVEFELRHYVESVKLLEQALAATHKPLAGKLRAETEAALERARAYVGEVQVETDPDTATVLVDGELIDRSAPDALRLDVGDHVFEFHAEGRLATKQTVSVKGGATETLRVTLPLLHDEVAAPATTQQVDLTTPPPVQAESAPLYTKWWLWTAVGVVVAAGVTTGVILLTQDDDKRTVPFTTKNTPPGSTFQTLTVAIP
jgi:tetratricopeptide (TPR) repeat protein